MHLHSVLAFCALVTVARAADVDFAADIRPLLADHCFHCHGPDESSRKGGLRLDLRETALQGGKSGRPAIAPGAPEASALLARVLSTDDAERMPPLEEKHPLDAAAIEMLRQWIRQGAPYSGHWAFEAPVKAPLPGTAARHPIDAFIEARLAAEGLAMSPPAAPETICRRLCLDLVGLPPSPAELDAFAAAVAAAGLDAAVRDKADALMADRRFGEKWARHWLDVARYSDTNGFEKDLPREQWAWRDWVVGAIQRDLPYDRFIIEQIAGDMLPDRTKDQVIATGFLRNSMINEEGAIVPEEFRMAEMFDRMDAVGSGILGLSLKCAQCHSHKFDPISHTEYFGVFAFLNNAYEAQSWVWSEEQAKTIAGIRDGIAGVEARLKKAHPDWAARLAAWEAAEIERQGRTAWTVVEAEDTHSSSELNHPAPLADGSILTLGHRTTSGDVHILAAPDLDGVTGIRLEVLSHGDLPFGGPGRSDKGIWALSELVFETRAPGAAAWERRKLVDVTCDFEEPVGGMEPEWENRSFDPDKRRLRGPAAFLADGDDKTAWRADRGRGRRNTDSVAVARFETPLSSPAGTKVKIALVCNHGGDDNGPKCAQLGRFRVSLTRSPEPRAEPVPYAAALALRTPAAERTPAETQAIFDAWRAATPEMKPFNDEIDRLWQRYPAAMTSVLHLEERSGAHARRTLRLDRGAWNEGREVVPPHVPAALHPLPDGAPPTRLAFARWLVDPRSPLAARVAVNRLWQAVFGVGIVETAEDFGTRAPAPAHRELLDWLAVDFVDGGWSRKRALRTLVTSAAYLRSSHAAPDVIERDPANRLLARGPRFRVDAEAVRDIALSAAGLLADKSGGPGVYPPVPASVLEYNYRKPDYWQPAEDASRYSRALYLFRKRSMPDPMLAVFDAPTGEIACARRPRSNTPLAALAAMNEPIFIEAAQALALRVLREGGADDAARADYAFRLCTSRMPSPRERAVILELLASRRERLERGELDAAAIAFAASRRAADVPAGATPNDVAAWAIVARVLLNLDETIAKS